MICPSKNAEKNYKIGLLARTSTSATETDKKLERTPHLWQTDLKCDLCGCGGVTDWVAHVSNQWQKSYQAGGWRRYTVLW